MLRVQLGALQELLEQQRQFTNYFFDHLDLNQVEEALQQCLECKGLLVLTGIGKSGIIAEKIAMTLMSTGSRSIYLPAANLLHGDIGGISQDDIVLMFSKSGETEELLDLLPHMRRKGCRVIAMVSDSKSRLAECATSIVCLPVEKELCTFDLAPTTSTAVQLLFGDLLAIGLMKEKGFSLEEYADNHPAGSIGKQITFTVRDLMKQQDELPTCKPEDKLMDVIVELSNKRCGCLMVLGEDQSLLGIFTDGDLRRGLQEEGAKVIERTMAELMTKEPVTVKPADLAYEAVKQMQSKRYVMVAPVVEHNRVIGLIRMHDIIHQGI